MWILFLKAIVKKMPDNIELTLFNKGYVDKKPIKYQKISCKTGGTFRRITNIAKK
jgi:hypothetical protein